MTIRCRHFTMLKPQCFTVLHSVRSSYGLCSHPDDRLHTFSRSNHKRRKSIETQEDLKCELITNNSLYAGAGGNHVWGIESFSLFFTEGQKTQSRSCESASPLTTSRSCLICSSKALSNISRSRLLCQTKVPWV